MNSTRFFHRFPRAIALLVVSACAIPVHGAADRTFEVSSSPASGLKFDVQPSAVRKVIPVYPYEMLMEGRTGWAEASFVIDYLGRPLFANPKGASDPAFAKAVVAMVEASEYSPARRGKHSVMAQSSEEFRFVEESFDADARRVLAQLRKNNSSIAAVSALDERPRALRQDSPAYPRALKDDGLTGQAEIEFVIDRTGRVLFPRIVSATHEDFGWAAATAVAQWRFKAPQQNGRAVDTIMRVPILFDAHKLASAD